MKAENIKPYYQRNLPHIQPIGACFFVTFRLKGSIPKQQIFQLKNHFDHKVAEIMLGTEQERDILIYNERKRFFGQYDALLDQAPNGPYHLQSPAIAELVTNEILRFNGQFYDLLAYCIMSNHVHLLIDTSLQLPSDIDFSQWESIDFEPLQNIMKRIKGPSAVNANRALGLHGQFWQRESYDHYVRDPAELQRIIWYILQNPVKVGLVERWEDFPFTFLKT